MSTYGMNLSKTKKGSPVFDIVVYLVMFILGAITIYPFINVLAISLNDANDTVRGGIYLLPRKFTLQSYNEIFSYGGLLGAFRMSVLRTVVGAVVTVVCSTMLSYTMSRKDFMARKFVSVLFMMTMYAGGGMIPVFLLMRSLHLTNTFWVYIVPTIVGAWYTFIIRSFIDGLPESLQESAKLDGANDFYIFIRIIFPLCMPVLATVALFAAVNQWNAWFDTYIYNGNKRNLTTLQFEMMKILMNAETAVRNLAAMGNGDSVNAKQLRSLVSPESVRMAMTIVATVPILVAYPFLQKYFVQGLTLGGVKA